MSGTIQCPICGKTVEADDDTKFCKYCGNNLGAAVDAAQAISSTAKKELFETSVHDLNALFDKSFSIWEKDLEEFMNKARQKNLVDRRLLIDHDFLEPIYEDDRVAQRNIRNDQSRGEWDQICYFVNNNLASLVCCFMFEHNFKEGVLAVVGNLQKQVDDNCWTRPFRKDDLKGIDKNDIFQKRHTVKLVMDWMHNRVIYD
jgi:endogenous inhibitor of DNA gyrase (YacG/DUF329 family)